MNPLLRQAVSNLNKRTTLTETQLNFVVHEMADLMLKVVAGIQENPNANMKGGDSIDENTLGNFHLELTNVDFTKL